MTFRHAIVGYLSARTLGRHCERSEAIHLRSLEAGLLRRAAPRNDERWNQSDVKSPQRLSPSAALSLLAPGNRVFVHAGPSECMTFVDAIRSDPERARGVDFVGVFIPGVNTTDYSALAPDARVTSTFVTPALSKSFQAGRVKFLPKAYSGFARTLAANPVDLAVLRLSPPGPDGRMSFGICQDYAPIAAGGAKRILAFVDHSMPWVHGEPGLRAEDCDALIEIDEKLMPCPAAPPGGTLAKVGATAATLIRDGDTIQIGIGKVQSAVLANLFDRRDLGLHSGMIDDAIAALAEKGVLDNSRKSADRGLSITGMAIGTEAGVALFAARKRPLPRRRLYAQRERDRGPGQFRRHQFGDRGRPVRPVQRRTARRSPDQRRRRLPRFPTRRLGLERRALDRRAAGDSGRREPHRRAAERTGDRHRPAQRRGLHRHRIRHSRLARSRSGRARGIR